VPECGKDDVERQWKDLEFDPPTSEIAWTDGYQNWQGWLRPGYLPLWKNCITIRLRDFAPRICEVADQMFTRLVFVGSSNSLVAIGLPRPKAAVPILKKRFVQVPFGSPENKILHSDHIPPKRKFSVEFRQDRKFRLKRALRTVGTSSINTPKTTSYAPLEVEWWIGKSTPTNQNNTSTISTPELEVD